MKYSELIQDLIFMDNLLDFINNKKGTKGKVLDTNYYDYPSSDLYREQIDDALEAFQFTPLIISYKNDKDLLKIINDNNICSFCLDQLYWYIDIKENEDILILTDEMYLDRGVPDYQLHILLSDNIILETINGILFKYEIEDGDIIYKSWRMVEVEDIDD